MSVTFAGGGPPNMAMKTGDVFSMRPIGRIESCFTQKNGTPRQASLAPAARARLRLRWGTNPAHALEGLAAFSHVWLLWLFDQNGGEAAKAKVKPPRLSQRS